MDRPLAEKRPIGPFMNIPSFLQTSVPEPDTSKQAVRVFTPTQSTASSSQVSEIQSKVEDMTGISVAIKKVTGGLMTSADQAGRGSVELPHEVLDVTETHIKKEIGITEKSTLIAANPQGKSLQSCFNPVQGQFTQKQLDEISTLASFVTGLDVKAEQVEQRLYIGSGTAQFGHIALDVMEIVSSRVAFAAGLNIQNNSMLIRGRVNE